MKKMLTPTSASLSMHADGSARLSMVIDAGKNNLEIVLSADLWDKLSKDARWFSAQEDEPAKSIVSPDSMELSERVKALETELTWLRDSAAQHADLFDAWSDEADGRLEKLESGEMPAIAVKGSIV